MAEPDVGPELWDHMRKESPVVIGERSLLFQDCKCCVTRQCQSFGGKLMRSQIPMIG